ncbi:hypothetical protein MES5069_490093 [Mesorhizobium escarrei]|uniref:Uncharacterized protein n=1 Tax=Mesorhizobium escarrei TaxID=666018 RepID=A0ABM9E9C7_9HYPH|nr:hypothetical protein MES5069_490093 [Mesorhizobium escarrei]
MLRSCLGRELRGVKGCKLCPPPHLDTLQLIIRFEWVRRGRSAEGVRSSRRSSICAAPLAFADPAAEFYAGSGNELKRALELAGMHVVNRPTPR